ncbi:kinase-like domain-containing protein [Pilobolus umbonatus]|nr:kinase-like domain-containing protein [Pilobolus umbonatus]
MSQDKYQADTVVGKCYKVGTHIGEGSFGVIYQGVDLKTKKPVAIKFESKGNRVPQLRNEYNTYKILEGTNGIPKVHYFGEEGLHNILVLDLLGSNLEDVFEKCGRKMPLKTLASLAVKMLSIIEAVHTSGFIYRDIKPDNFVLGRPGTSREHKVFLVDFGMAKLFRDKYSKKHIPYRENRCLSGTARYMSINTHRGIEQSRRDDLESLGHVFIYFLKGSLPWQRLKANNHKEKINMIAALKSSIDIKVLCEGLPGGIYHYMKYVREMKFTDAPNYEMLRSFFGPRYFYSGLGYKAVEGGKTVGELRHNMDVAFRYLRPIPDDYTTYGATQDICDKHTKSCQIDSVDHVKKCKCFRIKNMKQCNIM